METDKSVWDNVSSPVLDPFCRPDSGAPPDPALVRLMLTFRSIMVAISALGVAGNVLNLVTLRSPSLRNVPFMFIRALALFDLISLAAILVHFALDSLHINADPVVFYEVWVQDVLINSFLVAGLYCAVLLTIERYLLIRKPLSTGRRLFSIENTVLAKIGAALLAAVLLHSPMALRNRAKCQAEDPVSGECLRWAKGNNVELLCTEPVWSLFHYYQIGRECLRFFCVLLLVVLNAVIAHSLQITKKNRRLLIKRASTAPPELMHHQPNNVSSSSPPCGGENKCPRRELNLMRSFTEKKLTALMVAICVIFAIGNIPQMVVMVFQNANMRNNYNFQVFRHLANTAEVLNHCLNFFIFCMASSEYCRAFLSLGPVRWLLRHFPVCASLARARLNGHLENNSQIKCTALTNNQSASDCPSARKKSSLGTTTATLLGAEQRRDTGETNKAARAQPPQSQQQRRESRAGAKKPFANGTPAVAKGCGSGQQISWQQQGNASPPMAHSVLSTTASLLVEESGDDFL